MSCWVVPTVAAEFWGVTLDVVWRRIYEGLIPHKTDRGFIFVDVDPWTPDAQGELHHEPPPTFVTPQEPLLHQAPPAPPQWESPEPTQSIVHPVEELGAASKDESACVQTLDARDDREQDREDEDELPPLDEEESATFGRLSWHDVRQRVSRTRRPPPVFAD